MKYPDNVIDFYDSIPKDRLKEYSDEMWLWCREGIDETINIYLKDNKITKDDLHSIETKMPPSFGFPQRAIRSYEDRKWVAGSVKNVVL